MHGSILYNFAVFNQFVSIVFYAKQYLDLDLVLYLCDSLLFFGIRRPAANRKLILPTSTTMLV